MDTHEYQAKKILKDYQIPTPEFFVVSSLDEVNDLIQKQQLEQAVLKVQVHAGGRGKAGGIKIARNPDEIRQVARELLGKKIINNQTGKEGLVANQLLVTPPIEIAHEYYLGITIDRRQGRALLIASAAGGMDIEEAAHKTPEKVLFLSIPSDGQLRSYHYVQLAKTMGWTGDLAEQGRKLTTALVKAFHETDATLIEINPLVQTPDGKLIALKLGANHVRNLDVFSE